MLFRMVFNLKTFEFQMLWKRFPRQSPKKVRHEFQAHREVLSALDSARFSKFATAVGANSACQGVM